MYTGTYIIILFSPTGKINTVSLFICYTAVHKHSASNNMYIIIISSTLPSLLHAYRRLDCIRCACCTGHTVCGMHEVCLLYSTYSVWNALGVLAVQCIQCV